MTVVNKQRKRTGIRWVGGLLLLSAVVAVFWAGQAAGGKEKFATVTVQKASIEEVVTAQGKLEPKQFVDVGAQISGQLKKIHIAIGQVVKAGDLLAEIDARVYDSRVRADRARLKTLQAQHAEQRTQIVLTKQVHARHLQLIQSKAISMETLQTGEAALNAAEAQLMSIDAQIEEAQSTLEGDLANLSYTRIFAPMTGTVVSQSAREGQTLNANQMAPVILQIADLDTMTVRAQVAEADVMRLQPGMNVYFTTLGSQSRRWRGTVRQILPSPEIITDVVLYNALVDVDNRDRQLMTGMSTQMFFVLSNAENVPVIPVTALGAKLPDKDSADGQAYRVQVLSGAKPADRIIYVGLMDRRQAEVRKGLEIGENLVLQPQIDLPFKNGQRPPGFGPRI